MSLRDVEKKLESVFEGLFVKGFKSGVQPIELAKKLIKEMDNNKTLSVGKVYAPNEYTIITSMQDVKHLKPFEAVLLSDLADYLISHAKQKRYTLTETPEIAIEGDEDLSLGEVQVKSSLSATGESEQKDQTLLISPEEAKDWGLAPPSPASIVLRTESETLTFPLIKKATVVGRLHTNDIILQDPNVSRVHAEIKKEDDHFIVHDLGSTNGTLINGVPQKKWVLQDGDIISMGETELIFKE